MSGTHEFINAWDYKLLQAYARSEYPPSRADLRSLGIADDYYRIYRSQKKLADLKLLRDRGKTVRRFEVTELGREAARQKKQSSEQGGFCGPNT